MTSLSGSGAGVSSDEPGGFRWRRVLPGGRSHPQLRPPPKGWAVVMDVPAGLPFEGLLRGHVRSAYAEGRGSSAPASPPEATAENGSPWLSEPNYGRVVLSRCRTLTSGGLRPAEGSAENLGVCATGFITDRLIGGRRVGPSGRPECRRTQLLNPHFRRLHLPRHPRTPPGEELSSRTRSSSTVAHL